MDMAAEIVDITATIGTILLVDMITIVVNSGVIKVG